MVLKDRREMGSLLGSAHHRDHIDYSEGVFLSTESLESTELAYKFATIDVMLDMLLLLIYLMKVLVVCLLIAIGGCVKGRCNVR